MSPVGTLVQGELEGGLVPIIPQNLRFYWDPVIGFPFGRNEFGQTNSPLRCELTPHSRRAAFRRLHHRSLPFSAGITRFMASMATSIMESSGSLVVKFCIHRPGLAKKAVTGLSWPPT